MKRQTYRKVSEVLFENCEAVLGFREAGWKVWQQSGRCVDVDLVQPRGEATPSVEHNDGTLRIGDAQCSVFLPAARALRIRANNSRLLGTALVSRLSATACDFDGFEPLAPPDRAAPRSRIHTLNASLWTTAGLAVFSFFAANGLIDAVPRVSLTLSSAEALIVGAAAMPAILGAGPVRLSTSMLVLALAALVPELATAAAPKIYGAPFGALFETWQSVARVLVLYGAGLAGGLAVSKAGALLRKQKTG